MRNGEAARHQQEGQRSPGARVIEVNALAVEGAPAIIEEEEDVVPVQASMDGAGGDSGETSSRDDAERDGWSAATQPIRGPQPAEMRKQTGQRSARRFGEFRARGVVKLERAGG